MNKSVSSFLAKNRGRFGSADGLPAEFHRKALFDQVKVGKQAAYVTRHNSILSGRVVMKFATHAVLNLGGPHGTPGVLTPETCVFAAGATL